MGFLKFHPSFSGKRDSGENLKKVLALVLAFACAFTMFAGAAFTDQADIKVDADVVDTLVSLGVIEGFEDGSFQPNGTVTRAQMAKMIYVLRTGNSDASAYNDDKTSFTDIGSHWARGYIKYCQSLGIIAGKSNTIFAPNASVTAQEAAKMLLVTLGYDPAKAGLTGTNWASKTNALADENGLLEDVNTSFTTACPRQYAAQLIYNAIDTPTVVWRDDAYTNVTLLGDDNKTVGEKYMGLNTAEGVIESVSKDDGKTTYNMTLTNVSKKNGTEFVAPKNSNDKYYADVYFTKVAKDYTSLKNVKVKVLYKGTDKVYGVFALSEDNTTLSGVLGNFKQDGSKLKYNDVKYSVAAADKSMVKIDNGSTNKLTGNQTIDQWVKAEKNGLAKAFDTKAISNDGTSKINLLDVQSFAVAQVTYVGKDYINVSKKADDALATYTISKLEDDEAVYPSDLKKDDYVAVTAKANVPEEKYGVTKLETVTGKITSTKNSGDDDYKVQIDGTWYELAMASMNKEIKLNDTATVVVKDGYIVFVDDNKASSSDIALVIEVAKTSGVGSKYEADMLFADGSRKTVELNDNPGANFWNPVELSTEANAFLASYEISNGKYKLTKMSAKDTTPGVPSGYDEYEAVAFTKDNSGKITGGNTVDSNKMTAGNTVKYISTDAVVYVRYKSGSDTKYRVTTGTDMRNWSKNSVFASQALAKESNGYNYANVVFADMAAGLPGGSGVTYAYIFGSSSTRENDTDYIVYEAWNGTKDIDLKVEGTTVKYSEGAVVEYTVDSEGVATLTDVATKDNWTKVGAITGYDYNADKMDGTISIKAQGDNKATDYEIDTDDDAYVLFIDTDDGSGAQGVVQKAGDVAGKDTYMANAAVKNLGNGKVIIVVDSTNELKTSLFTSTDLSAGIAK
ncbi:S-layer homology domain-containing protein [Agathobaculum butyriciproducens]|nr:S-layer homology domain-containing protein [Agathobaculum butyriciproducens]